MEEINLNIEIRNENGELSNDLFEIETKALDILTGVDGTGKVSIDFRPVHLYTLTDDVDVVPPKPRVY